MQLWDLFFLFHPRGRSVTFSSAIGQTTLCKYLGQSWPNLYFGTSLQNFFTCACVSAFPLMHMDGSEWHSKSKCDCILTPWPKQVRKWRAPGHFVKCVMLGRNLTPDVRLLETWHCDYTKLLWQIVCDVSQVVLIKAFTKWLNVNVITTLNIKYVLTGHICIRVNKLIACCRKHPGTTNGISNGTFGMWFS